MEVSDLNPIRGFEGLSRNQKLVVFAGALALAGYLYWRSKKKKNEEGQTEGEGEAEGQYAANGTYGQTAEGQPSEGEFFDDEGVNPYGYGANGDPYAGGGISGTAPAGAVDVPSTSTADGTVPSVPGTGPTTNIYVGEGAGVTGGGAPVTPHPAHAHLPARRHKLAPTRKNNRKTGSARHTHTRRPGVRKAVHRTTHRRAHARHR